MAQAKLRGIPKVDDLLGLPALSAWTGQGHAKLALDCVRAELDALRAAVLAGTLADIPAPEAIAGAAARRVEERLRGSLRRVINATGVPLHTNLGRAPLPGAAAAAAIRAAQGYSNLEYDLEAGARGERSAHVAGLLTKLTGAQTALVVNNNAGAVLLALSALAQGKEVIIARGELVEIGGAFRVPQVMEQSGCALREVGTTNRSYARDYEQAVIPGVTGAVMKVHTSNYRIVGFCADVCLEELAAIAEKHGLPLIHDLGSGVLTREVAAQVPCLNNDGEPTVEDSVKAGADLVCFSGDKLLGGPQAGILVGKARHIEIIKRHPLMRALRPDKLQLAALEATLRLWAEPNLAVREVPVLAMLAQPPHVLEGRAKRLAALMGASSGAGVEVVATADQAGGGSLPGVRVSSWAVAVSPRALSVDELAARLQRCALPVIGHIQKDCLLLEARTLADGDLEYVAGAILAALAGERP